MKSLWAGPVESQVRRRGLAEGIDLFNISDLKNMKSREVVVGNERLPKNLRKSWNYLLLERNEVCCAKMYEANCLSRTTIEVPSDIELMEPRAISVACALSLESKAGAFRRDVEGSHHELR